MKDSHRGIFFLRSGTIILDDEAVLDWSMYALLAEQVSERGRIAYIQTVSSIGVHWIRLEDFVMASKPCRPVNARGNFMHSHITAAGSVCDSTEKW